MTHLAKFLLLSSNELLTFGASRPALYNVATIRSHSSFNKNRNAPKEEEEFRVLDILPRKKEGFVKRETFQRKIIPPRSLKMAVDQDWPSVWPGPRTFHPATVPLPVRQGYSEKKSPPSKYGNAELMKIPNFLHLTPPAIERHCAALKRFCTPWPEQLSTDEDMDRNFPVNIIASDYCHSAPTIRDPQARVISLKVKLSSLELDEHARDKLLRLVGERYDPETDIITITTDSCPLKKQNYDYAQYLLAALYHESWNVEDWEAEKTLGDQERYVWEDRPAKESVLAMFSYNKRTAPDLSPLAQAVESLFNGGEDEKTLAQYKQAVLATVQTQK